MTEPKPSDKTLGELAAELAYKGTPNMTKPKSAGEIAEQLAITLDPDCRNSGDQRVFVVNKITLAIQSAIDSTNCCGCAGLREALEKCNAAMLRHAGWQQNYRPDRVEESMTRPIDVMKAEQLATKALSAPCTCQGATGEEQELIADWAALLHRPSISEDSLRDGLTKFAATLRRVQPRKEA